MDKSLSKKIRKGFTTAFHKEPFMVFSPGRINLIGEHVDYNDGFVFPAAVDKGITLAIQTSDSSTCTAVAFDFEETFSFNLENLKTLDGGGWRNFVIGVIKEIEKTGKSLKPFNILFGGDVPSGAGMSSSAALENAIVYGLNELFQLNLTKKEMIFISQKAEHNYVGVKCGIMDQFASMFGQENHFLLLDCRTLEYTPYPIALQDYELVLINSNVQHNLSDSTYNKRRALCEKATALIGKSSLRDVNKALLESYSSNFSEEEYQMLLYVVEEIERTILASKALEDKDISRLGELLFETHKGLSTQYKVSCEELDFLVDYAQKDSKVVGSRMMGGGFGGCTINIIEKAHVEEFTQNIGVAYKEQFGYECTPIYIKLSQGTSIIS
jgi:galactokinase